MLVPWRFAGMDWFDAVCHGFSALALGGFSTYDANVRYFQFLPIELVLTVFQILAAMNFATIWPGASAVCWLTHDAGRRRSSGPQWPSCAGARAVPI
jgi:Trk-type K+ transport system membrane component